MGYIAGIGGANMDIHGRSERQLVMRDSNPGTLHMSLGGVCRNICENLVRLGETVRLITVVGEDVHGRSILEGCRAVGIDMSAAQVIPGERSSSYISIMDGDGDMLLAMSDMHIIKRLSAQLVDASRDVLSGADLVVCDGNLSSATIERLTQVCTCPLYLDPVSTAWAREVRPFIGCFDTIKPNRMELETLAQCRSIRARTWMRRVTASSRRAFGACSSAWAGMACFTKGRKGRSVVSAARLTAWSMPPARAMRRWPALCGLQGGA